MMVVHIRKVQVLNLDLNKINDYYTREVFRQLIAYLSKSTEGQAVVREVTNNLVQRIPLDGSESISGTIEPDQDGTRNIGSETKRLGEVHTRELFVDSNTLYVGGEPALSKEPDGTVVLSSGDNKNVKVTAKGTGKVIIDAETDVEITTTGSVTINDALISAGLQYHQRTYTSTMVVNGNQLVLEHEPTANSLNLFLNGIEESNYSLNINVVTLDFNMDVGDTVKAVYTH